MIRARLQIADGEIKDTFDEYGLIYLDADKRTGAEIKDLEETTYAEQDGSNTDPHTTFGTFDFKVTFLISTPNRKMENANAKIAAFNKLLYDTEADSDLKVMKQVAFYDDLQGIKIVGYPKTISEPKTFYRDQRGRIRDCVSVEWTIQVKNPDLCEFE
jgi:hypothetical protein